MDASVDMQHIFRGGYIILNTRLQYAGSNFIFHDSQGFESGAIEELEDVWKFIEKQSATTEVKDQLHAIWYLVLVFFHMNG